MGSDLHTFYVNKLNHINIIVDKGFLTWAPGLQPRDSPGGPTRAAVNAPLTGYIILKWQVRGAAAPGQILPGRSGELRLRAKSCQECW